MAGKDTKTSELADSSTTIDSLSDPFEAVLDTIDHVKEHGLSSFSRRIGYIIVNGKKAQVTICVDTNQLNWVQD